MNPGLARRSTAPTIASAAPPEIPSRCAGSSPKSSGLEVDRSPRWVFARPLSHPAEKTSRALVSSPDPLAYNPG